MRGLSGKKSPDVELPVTEYEEKKMLKEKCREEILRAKKAEHGLRTAQEREQELEHLISKTLLEVEEWKKKYSRRLYGLCLTKRNFYEPCCFFVT